MSWQHIDENTYIDDTLVTCAEYQLFIDEIHEQDLYYQPDHWASLRFPPGKAREPIFGVRSADAVAFCNWLTQRENSGWEYRLPTKQEASHFLINHSIKLSGYWLAGKFQFAWIGSTPNNARSYSRGLGRALGYPFNIAIDQCRNLALDIDINRDLIHSSELNTLVEQVFNRSAEDFSLRAHNLDTILLFSRRLATSKIETFGTNNQVDPLLRLYADLLTLRDRLGGRHPAFEGIRLVKERIK
jgi:hypothetical protein